MSDSPAAILYDNQGNPVGVVLDDTIYRLQTEAKLAAGHGLALEETLLSVKDTDGIKKITDPVKVVLYDEDDNPVGFVLDGAIYRVQTETKLAAGHGLALDASVGEVKTVLESIKDTDGVKKITDPVGAVLEDAAGNKVTVVADDGGVFLLRTYAKLAPSEASIGFVGIVDKAGTHKANVTPGGQLETYSPQPTPPPGTTEVRISAVSSLSGAIESTPYEIPNGEVLVIQFFSGGAADSLRDSKVSLCYDPLGTGLDMEMLRTAYVGNSNFDFSMGLSFVGDGTARIVLTRQAIDGGPREIAGFWSGYRYTP